MCIFSPLCKNTLTRTNTRWEDSTNVICQSLWHIHPPTPKFNGSWWHVWGTWSWGGDKSTDKATLQYSAQERQDTVPAILYIFRTEKHMGIEWGSPIWSLESMSTVVTEKFQIDFKHKLTFDGEIKFIIRHNAFDPVKHHCVSTYLRLGGK